MARYSQLVKRLVTPYFVLMTATVAVSMVFIGFAVVSRAERDTERVNRRLAERNAGQVAAYIDDLVVIADQVTAQSAITGHFYELMSDPVPGNAFDKDVLASIDVSSALLTLIMSRAADCRIAVLNGAGDYISSHTYLVDKDKLSIAMHALDYTAVLERIRRAGGCLVSPPSPDPVSYGDTVFITVAKALKNEYSTVVSGVVEVRGSADRLRFPATEDGACVRIEDRYTHLPLFDEPVPDLPGYAEAPIDGTDWIVAVRYPDPVGRTFLTRIFLIFALLFVALTAFVFLLTVTIGHAVTKPITSMTKRVGAINAPGEKLERDHGKPIDEIRELENGFEKMLARVNDSAKQEQKAYAVALQAQMNPHFLYNTLAVIGECGAEDGSEKVAEMCVRLSDMLRYVASYEKVTVPLAEEIAHTENYLSLMKARYEEGFDYTLNVSDALLAMPVPKLIIQPLAENCFKHGFGDAPQPWHIDVTVFGTPERWTLTVRDNGNGMTKARIDEITKRIESALAQPTLAGPGGLGLVHTVVSLRYAHAKDLRYRLDGSHGATVEITAVNE